MSKPVSWGASPDISNRETIGIMVAIGLAGLKQGKMEYTVSPDWLGFNSDGKYPSDHRISRKTLKYQTSAMNDNMKCILEDVDTSGNLL